MIPAGILGGVNQIQTGLINGHRIQGYQNADISNGRILRHGAAVAVHAHVLHDVDVHSIALEEIHHGRCRVCHGAKEAVVIRSPDLLHITGAVDIGLAVGGCHTDGKLLQRAAETAHGMALEMGQHQHAVVIGQVLANVILLNHLAVGNLQHQIRACCVQQVNCVKIAPAVLLKSSNMPLGGVPLAFVGSVAFNYGAAHMRNYVLPEFRPEEILVARLAGVNLNRHIAGKFFAQQLVQLQHLFSGDGF